MPWKFGLLKLDYSTHSHFLRQKIVDGIVNCVNLIAAGMLIYVLIMCAMHKDPRAGKNRRTYPGDEDPRELDILSREKYLQTKFNDFIWSQDILNKTPDDEPLMCRKDVCESLNITFDDIGMISLSRTANNSFAIFECQNGAAWNRSSPAFGFWKCGNCQKDCANKVVEWSNPNEAVYTSDCGYSDTPMQLISELLFAVETYRRNSSVLQVGLPFPGAYEIVHELSEDNCMSLLSIMEVILSIEERNDDLHVFLSHGQNYRSILSFLNFFILRCSTLTRVHSGYVDIIPSFASVVTKSFLRTEEVSIQLDQLSIERAKCSKMRGVASNLTRSLNFEVSSEGILPDDECSFLVLSHPNGSFYSSVAVDKDSMFNLKTTDINVMYSVSNCSQCKMKIKSSIPPGANTKCLLWEVPDSSEPFMHWNVQENDCYSPFQKTVTIVVHSRVGDESPYDSSDAFAYSESYPFLTIEPPVDVSLIHDSASYSKSTPIISPAPPESATTPVFGIAGIFSYLVSLVCLLATLGTYGLFPKLRRERTSSKLLLALCTCLSLYIITMLLTIPYVKTLMGCQFALVMRVYLTLVTLTWNSIEVCNIYLILIRFFPPNLDKFMRKALLVGLGLPAVVVIVPVAAKPELFKGHFVGCDWVCNLPEITRNYILLLPMSVYVCFNLLAYALILRVLLNKSLSIQCHVSSENHAEARENFRYEIKSSAGLLVLFSVTWTVSAFIVINFSLYGPVISGPWEVVMHLIYALMIALQGIFVFTIHCVCPPDARKQWASIWHGVVFIAGALPRKLFPKKSVTSPLVRQLSLNQESAAKKFRFSVHRKGISDGCRRSESVRFNNINDASHV